MDTIALSSQHRTVVTASDSLLPILSQISIFGGFDAEDLEKFLPFLEVGRFRKGEPVFQRGDEPTHIYIVKSGKIDLEISAEGAKVEIKLLGVGETFGEASLIAMRRHTATAVACEDSEIAMLSRRALIELQKKNIKLFAILIMNLARDLARRLQLTDDILLHYVHPVQENAAIQA